MPVRLALVYTHFHSKYPLRRREEIGHSLNYVGTSLHVLKQCFLSPNRPPFSTPGSVSLRRSPSWRIIFGGTCGLLIPGLPRHPCEHPSVMWRDVLSFGGPTRPGAPTDAADLPVKPVLSTPDLGVRRRARCLLAWVSISNIVRPCTAVGLDHSAPPVKLVGTVRAAHLLQCCF